MDGNFRVKEAYLSLLNLVENQSRFLWGKFWLASLRPKFSTFLWLVVNINILTWEFLLCRGFMGLSRCIICLEEKETQDHLLGSCKFTAQLWDTGSTLFNKMDLRNHKISKTIDLWSNNPYINPILNRAWETFMGFLMWNVWKERNRRIFKE